MKKITFLAFLLTSFISFAQVINQPANWPNTNWTITGTYLTDPDVFEADPTTSANFSYDDDDAQNGNDDDIAAESPIIDLTAALNAGETWIVVRTDYTYRIINELLRVQYWDADASSWVTVGNPLAGTTNGVGDNFCSGDRVPYTSDPLDISGFTPNQLQNFRYRLSYDDNNTWGWGFCFDSPTITSQTPPTCPNLTNISVSAGDTFANVFWTPGSSETAWEIVVQAQGTGVPTGNGLATTDNSPHVVNGLTATTDYEVYVRGNCGGGDFSDWIGPVNFTTLTPARVNFSIQPMGIGGYDLAVVDMNGDHLDDIVSVSSTNVNIHYQQSGGGFSEENIPTPNADFLPTWSMAAADYDANGYTDLLYGSGSGVTFMRSNDSGNGFTESSGPDYVFSQRSNFADINRDGHLDAFVCHDVQPNVYYINDGSGNFTFYQSGVTPGAPFNLGDYPSGGDYGSIWIDYDNDRDLDMFIAKCGGETARRRNAMLTYDSDTNTYIENANALGLDDPMQTWSSSWGDYDNDGDMDLFVGASSGSHKLMENNGDGTFSVATTSIFDIPPTGFENVSYDIDNDGNLDILCNGTILYGRGDMTFEDADSDQINYKNGSLGDLNNDGFIDAYYNGNIYWNLGTSNNWITINTVGTASNIDGIGARVEIYSESGTQIRDVRSGEGFEFMSTMNTHFGLGTDTNVSHIIIYWPNSGCEVFLNPPINQAFVAVEGSGDSCDILGVDDETLANDFSIMPNPTKDVITIQTGLSLENAIYNVFDISGRRIMTNSLNNNNTIDVSQLSAGNYILSIISGNTIRNQKFIKQ